MKDKVKTLKAPSKKAEHKAKIAALKQKAIDALNDDIKFKHDTGDKLIELERRIEAVEKRPAQQGKQGDKGDRGEEGSGFWGKS